MPYRGLCRRRARDQHRCSGYRNVCVKIDRFWTPSDAPRDTRPKTLFKIPALPQQGAGTAHDPLVTTIGYARVSTADQSLDMQLDALEAAGCTRVYSDTASGALDSRPGLALALDAVAAGDILVVWRLDRLGRSLAHLVATVDGLGSRGVALRSLHEQIDTSTATGRLTLGIFTSLAEFERELTAERTAAGLAAARRRGTRLGRPSVWSDEKAAAASAMLAGNASVAAVARALGVSRGTVYRHA